MAKTALVTGASSGIGEATVRHLLADGFTVYAGARRLERMRPLARAGAKLLALDVTDDASMVDAVDRIVAETGRIDALVNNAGYGSYGAVEDVPIEEGRRQFEVNVIGLARLTQLVIPVMRGQKAGRIVNVSSMGGRISEPLGAWYHATKFAVEGLSDCLRMELKPFGIDVVVIQPGAIRTEWGPIAAQSLLEVSGSAAYRGQAERHARFLAAGSAEATSSPPEMVAETIAQALSAARPRTRYPTGKFARLFLGLRWLMPDRMFDWFMHRVEARTAR
jgi:NAD(P)-dependent dehydrogenase (short-subunit alcohol dehydrogenase family)